MVGQGCGVETIGMGLLLGNGLCLGPEAVCRGVLADGVVAQWRARVGCIGNGTPRQLVSLVLGVLRLHGQVLGGCRLGLGGRRLRWPRLLGLHERLAWQTRMLVAGGRAFCVGSCFGALWQFLLQESAQGLGGVGGLGSRSNDTRQ